MKKRALLLLVLLAFSCKKEPAPEPEPAPAPPPTPPHISVKINGVLFSCSGCTSTYETGGMHGVNFHFPNSQDRLLFSFSSYPAKGSYPFVKFGNPSFVYQKNNVYYRAVNGTLNLTEVDTSSNGAISKFVCTFSCQTDTTQNEFFNFTEGVTNKK